MLVTVLISFVVVAVVFAVINKYTKKTEQPVTLDDNGSKPKETPVVGPLEEEDGWNWKEEVGYETSSLVDIKSEQQDVVSEVIIEKQPKPKAKKKMSAKPKAPKKKKDA